MLRLLGVFLFFIMNQAFADDQYWIDGPYSDEIATSYQKGSYELSKNKDGDDIAILVAKTLDKRTKSILLNKIYVSINDCRRQVGKIAVLNMNGQYLYDNDFAYGAGSIATLQAEFICAVWKSTQKNADGKSL